MDQSYVHGYSQDEARRLTDQAGATARLWQDDVRYPTESSILEAGCGVGAQTAWLARNNPDCHFTCLDLSAASLEQAKALTERLGLHNVTFRQGDIYAPPFPPESFDHVFLCFVLEHLSQPSTALQELRQLLRPGGSITAIEGDHGSTLFHPDSPPARQAIQCLVDLQASLGGDALIGRRLFPLLQAAGFQSVSVQPRVVAVDNGCPQLADEFTQKTFIAMVTAVRDQAVENGLITAEQWKLGMDGLRRSTEPDGTFYYTFFQGKGIRGE